MNSQDEHGDGDYAAEESVEPEVHSYCEEGEEKHDCATEESEEVGGVGEDTW